MATKKKPRTIVDVDTNGKETIVPLTGGAVAISKPIITKADKPGYFSRVVSNVKGNTMDIPLAPCTAIVSERNRAGKTAVLDAFRLALTGKHPIGADAADLAGLTLDGSYPKAGISGELSTSIFQFPEGKKTPQVTTTGEFQQLTDEVGKLLPLVANHELLTLGAAKAREALFRRFGGATLAAGTECPVGLTPEQAALWDKALTGASHGLDTVEKLAAAGTWIRSHKRTLSASVKALEEEKERLHNLSVASGAGTPTEDLLNAIQKKIDTHKALANTTLMRSRAAQSESRLLELVETFKATPQPMDEATFERTKLTIAEKYPINTLQATVERGQPALAAAQGQVRLLKVLVGIRKHALSTGICLACESAIGGNTAQLKEAEAGLASAEGTVGVLMHQLEQDEMYLTRAQSERNAEFLQLEATRAQQTNIHHRLVTDLRAAKANYEAAQEMLKEAGVAEVPSEPMEVLQQQLQALQNAKAEGGRATQLAVDLRKLATEQEDVKTVEKSLAGRLSELVVSVRTTAQAAVNAWMPPGFKAALMLEDEEGKPTCRWEIIGADNRPHPRGAASGAEWAALTVAIACAWSDGQKFRFLLLDDTDLAGFSAENVKNALTMVAQAVAEGRLTQALVAWSRPMEIPGGWSVVAL